MNWTGMTLFERIRFIVEHAERIFVRARVDGKWQSVAISAVPEADLVDEISRLASREVEPSRIVEQS